MSTYSFPVKMVLFRIIIRCSVGRDQIVQWAFIRLIWARLSDLYVLNGVKCSERCLFCIAIWFVLADGWFTDSLWLLSADTKWRHFRFSSLLCSLWSYYLFKNLISSFRLSFWAICKEKWFFDNCWLLVGLTYLKIKIIDRHSVSKTHMIWIISIVTYQL